jgi:hypothetical protein
VAVIIEDTRFRILSKNKYELIGSTTLEVDAILYQVTTPAMELTSLSIIKPMKLYYKVY